MSENGQLGSQRAGAAHEFRAIAFDVIAFAKTGCEAQIGCDAATQQN